MFPIENTHLIDILFNQGVKLPDSISLFTTMVWELLAPFAWDDKSNDLYYKSSIKIARILFECKSSPHHAVAQKPFIEIILRKTLSLAVLLFR